MVFTEHKPHASKYSHRNMPILFTRIFAIKSSSFICVYLFIWHSAAAGNNTIKFTFVSNEIKITRKIETDEEIERERELEWERRNVKISKNQPVNQPMNEHQMYQLWWIAKMGFRNLSTLGGWHMFGVEMCSTLTHSLTHTEKSFVQKYTHDQLFRSPFSLRSHLIFPSDFSFSSILCVRHLTHLYLCPIFNYSVSQNVSVVSFKQVANYSAFEWWGKNR